MPRKKADPTTAAPAAPVATLPTRTKVKPFDLTFVPANRAVQFLAKIANTEIYAADTFRFHEDWFVVHARAILEEWRASLATPEQMSHAQSLANVELEIDDEGACVSIGKDGYFIQTWTWVAGFPDPDADVLDEDRFDGNDDHIDALKERVRELRELVAAKSTG